MRKIVACVGAALLLSVVVAPGSSAAVTAGAACKKAGQVSTAGGMKYTCVKKGSKLVWGKGIAVKAAPSASASVAPSASAEPTVSASGYTMAKVKTHASAASCWSVINGNVYDLTAWINQHPGGSGAILSLCGTDGTAGFTGMHQGQRKPESRLSGYLMGPLSK
jgi:cytochrome b involved in lipid metabolism